MAQDSLASIGNSVNTAGAMTVLLVDDDPDIRSILRMILEIRGHRILEAGRGELALRLAKEHHPDLIILDWTMPSMSGIEVARALREDPSSSETPLIMLTARAEDENLERGKEAGIFAYLVKPVSPLEFLSVVDSALEG